SASCSPAEPASASPVTENVAPIPIRRLAVMPRRAGRVRRHRVSSLLCAPGDISTLRRQNFYAGGRPTARPEIRVRRLELLVARPLQSNPTEKDLAKGG